MPAIDTAGDWAERYRAQWNETYRANPVTVKAFVIEAVDQPDTSGCMQLLLSMGSTVLATPEMTSRYTPVPGDYWVLQEDGYSYINPKQVFERKYRPAYASMTFGDAIELLKRGTRVARRGWNGKGMWLSYSPGSSNLPADRFWSSHNRDFATTNGGVADVLPCITMKTADDKILMGWLASQTDMLADDWVVIP